MSAGRRVGALLGAFAVAQLAQYGSFLLSWVVLGRAALAGTVDGGTIAGWAALVAASLACRAATVRLQAALAVVAGGWLRERMLRGALGLDAGDLVRAGSGRLLGRLLEAETVEDQVVGAALPGLGAVLDLVLAAVPLAAGLGPAALLALAGWLAVAGWALARYARHRGEWTAARLALGEDLVGKLAGHRTRAVQQPPARWHDGEDAALAGYAAVSRPMDRCRAVLAVVVPRGFALTGVVLLAAAAGRTGQAGVAAGAAGVLFGTAALTRLATGLTGLADARAAWRQLRALLGFDTKAPGKPTVPLPREPGEPTDPGKPGEPGEEVVVARGLRHRYPGRGGTALDATDLRIRAGDRVLLDGPSGAGRSTLAALLAGTITPTGGTLRTTRGVLSVPPADRNHLLLAPLALNLLLGRGWPATPDDLREADEVCRALGLGDLLDRMPSGLAQLVGETGWQLSAGQRSLVHLARALLQRPEVLVLDQTLDALDPGTLRAALDVAADRATTLVVVRS